MPSWHGVQSRKEAQGQLYLLISGMSVHCFCSGMCVVLSLTYYLSNLKGNHLGGPMQRWENNTAMDLKEIGYGLHSSGIGESSNKLL
jgi:hypothetical protein